MQEAIHVRLNKLWFIVHLPVHHKNIEDDYVMVWVIQVFTLFYISNNIKLFIRDDIITLEIRQFLWFQNLLHVWHSKEL